jgi:hypothetical protein
MVYRTGVCLQRVPISIKSQIIAFATRFVVRESTYIREVQIRFPCGQLAHSRNNTTPLGSNIRVILFFYNHSTFPKSIESLGIAMINQLGG